MDLDIFDPAVKADPYPVYEALRAQGPVTWSPRLGAWLVLGYDAACAVLGDVQSFTNRRRETRPRGDTAGDARAFSSPTMLNEEPPDHTRLRGLAARAFTPRSVALLEPRIRAITEELLAPFPCGSAFDVVDALAYPLPVIVIAEMLGIPPGDRDFFKRCSDNVVSLNETSTPEDVARVQASSRELREYLSGVIDERRTAPRDDLISRFLDAATEHPWFDDGALLDMCVLLLIAGNETTTNLISAAVLALARFPDQRRKLVEQPALMPAAVEEFLRFDGPVQLDPRIAARDATLDNATIPAGSVVHVVLTAANRDPAQFADPTSLDLTRATNPHIAFGRGIHFCLGAPLARLEARIALEALVRRFPHYELVASGPLEYGPSFILRGLRRLPIAVA